MALTIEQQRAIAIARARRRRAEPAKAQEPVATPVSTTEKVARAIMPNWIERPADAAIGERGKQDVSRMFANVPDSAKRYASNFIGAFAHPIETGKATGRLLGEMAAAPFTGAHIGNLQERGGALGAVAGELSDRYGSVDALRQTAIQDPIGAGLDVATLGTGAAMGTAKGASIAANAIPARTSRRMLADALRMRPGMDRDVKDKIVDTMLKEGIKPTAGGLNKADNLIDSLNSQIDELIASAPAENSIPADAVLRHFDALKSEMGGVNLQGSRNIAAIDDVANRFREHMAAIGKDSITPQELQKFKKDTYKDIKFDRDMYKSDAATDRARSAAARAARESLEEISPNIGPINRREGDIIQLMEELPGLTNKMENYRPVGMDMALKTLMGTGIGSSMGPTGAGVGGMLGAAAGVLAHPRVRAQNAFLVEALRNSAPASAYVAEQLKPILLSEALLQLGKD